MFKKNIRKQFHVSVARFYFVGQANEPVGQAQEARFVTRGAYRSRKSGNLLAL